MFLLTVETSSFLSTDLKQKTEMADRISDLPSDIISCILDRTPIRDAVATSILSRDWRHKWRSICMHKLHLLVCNNGTVICDLISKCPLLERLSLNVTSLSHPLVIDVDRESTLMMSSLFDLDSDVLPTLMNVQSVTNISLKIYRRVMDFCYLISIFGSVPKVETVVLRPPQALVDMPPDAPMSLPNTLHNHKSLTLLQIAFSSPQCNYFVLCILKSSPNLQMLNLQIRSSGTSDDEAALHFLDMQAREPLTLNSLLTAKIEGLSGSRVETMFIKMILSCSPILKMMHLTGEDTLNEAELLQCPRSSSRAQVIYS